MSASATPSTAAPGRSAATSALLRLRSDEQLVEAFRGGQDAAFQAIHDRYRPRLFAYARQMLGGSPQDAEDALQDVFLRAYGALRADDRPITLRAWLYRVAHNRCVDQMRRPAPTPVEASEDTPSAAVDPLVAAEQREDLRRLVTDIRALPEQQRSALLMREMDGMAYTELGAALGVTVPAVKSLLVRARMGLAEAGEARETGCEEIRTDLADSHDRRVRSSARARRHMGECAGCRAYRASLKQASAGIAALTPASPGPLIGLAHALGLGGAGSGALAAGAGGAATVSSGATVVGATTTKVAAVLGAAAVAAGGGSEVVERVTTSSPPEHRQGASASPLPAPTQARATPPDQERRSRRDQQAEREPRADERQQREDSTGGQAGEGAPAGQAAPATGAAGDERAQGESGGGPSPSSGDAPGSSPRTPVEQSTARTLRASGEVVEGVLSTVERTTEAVSSSGSAEHSTGTRGTAARNDPSSEHGSRAGDTSAP